MVKKYRSEQQEELEAQRSEMEAERAKAQEMMDELARLRAQLGGTPADGGSEEPPAQQPVPVSEAPAQATGDQTEGE